MLLFGPAKSGSVRSKAVSWCNGQRHGNKKLMLAKTQISKSPDPSIHKTGIWGLDLESKKMEECEHSKSAMNKGSKQTAYILSRTTGDDLPTTPG
jgi:hypothetical protein